MNEYLVDRRAVLSSGVAVAASISLGPVVAEAKVPRKLKTAAQMGETSLVVSPGPHTVQGDAHLTNGRRTVPTPIVFVPGLLCSAEVFAPQAAALWACGPVTVSWTLEGKTMAEIAAAILKASPPHFALVGHSMGGYICMEILRQAPERVLKLALLDTSARPDTPDQTRQRRAAVEAAGKTDFAAWGEEANTSLAHPARRTDPDLRAINRRMTMAVGLEGFARQIEAVIARPDSRPSLPAVKVPTLVLVGAEDALTPPERAQEIASLIAGAKLVVVPECGHTSPLEQPTLVSAALTEWMQVSV